MWQYFDILCYAVAVLILLANALLYSKASFLQKISLVLYAISVIVMGVFITQLWISLERPPLRTLAETRIWYSFFVAAIGWVLYLMYRYKWIVSYSSIMTLVFLGITFFHPDTQNKTLMPALHSVWFIPHVVVYIFAYAMFGMATVLAVFGLYKSYIYKNIEEEVMLVNKFINIGYTFLTLGLLFGALWAKEAWGHYWTWDPKETWAFITWLGYLIYIHLRYKYKNINDRQDFIIIIIAFILLLMCWFGVNYLPTAANSVHTYSG